MLLQIPRTFDPLRPCMVVVASSGSRGIWGALPTAGEWGLRRGCAVAHTDKGTGTGFDEDAAAGPHAIVTRHAHSGVNPEAHWGEYLIDAARLGFEWLNREYHGRRAFGPANTLVIASGISNGGGAVLRALELDRAGARDRWFDAAVVAEPNVAPLPRQPLLDTMLRHALLQPCAVLDAREASAPAAAALPREALAAWCAELARGGEVRGADTAAQAADARAQLLASGIRPEALALGPQNVLAQLWPSLAVTYASAYQRRRPDEDLCGFSFAAVDAAGRPRPLTPAERARLSADGNGIPPTAGIVLVRDAGAGTVAGGGAADPGASAGAAAGASAAAAATVTAVRCLRAAAEGPRVQAGLREIALRGDPGDRPVIVLHGRDDGLIPVQLSSRAWYAAVLARRPHAARTVRYHEIRHVQHFDAWLGLPGFATRYVPMQPWLLAAMDEMHARLVQGRPLAPSQVLRPSLRALDAAGAVAPLRAAQLRVPVRRPAATERIVMRDGGLQVPE
ncbi:MAG: 3-hydroxybutyrate oligomer hydrolase family protein [Steroidobacteraceae bacterium]